MKVSKKKKVILIVCISIVFVVAVIFGLLAGKVYNDEFDRRIDTPDYYKYEISDFNDLKSIEHTFASNNGQKLAGYTFYNDNVNKNGVIVMAHGFGRGGQSNYMHLANYFVSNGYYVFAYDATANDKSEGEKVKGLSQGLIDLDYALNYIKTDSTLKDLPVMLFGHSWGGYSVSSVLNIHKDIAGVISVAGFNKPTDIMKEEGLRLAGAFTYAAMPYISAFEKINFGKYSDYSSLEGYRNSTSKVMIIHSEDDPKISIENSYDIYYDNFKDDNRFTFVRFKDRGHGDIFYTPESLAYIEKLDRDFEEYCKSQNQKETTENKIKYMNEHFDKEIAFNFNEELMSNIIEFYDMCVDVSK